MKRKVLFTVIACMMAGLSLLTSCSSEDVEDQLTTAPQPVYTNQTLQDLEKYNMTLSHNVESRSIWGIIRKVVNVVLADANGASKAIQKYNSYFTILGFIDPSLSESVKQGVAVYGAVKASFFGKKKTEDTELAPDINDTFMIPASAIC